MHDDLLAQKLQLLQTDFPERLVKSGEGVQIAWRETGDASSDFAVVLLHGISSGAASWMDVALHMPNGVRILAWDAPGYGVSTPLSQSVPADTDYAQALAQSLYALGVRRCLLVGHSLGALIAVRLAIMAAPAFVEQLVLISPAGGYGAAAKGEQQAKVRGVRLTALAEKGVAGLAVAIDQRLVSAEASEGVRAWVRWNTARMQPQGYAQAVELLCGSDLARAQGRLGMPVEVWVGEHDVVTTPVACKAWSELLGAHYGTLAAAGHASPVEQPSEVAHRLASLLNQSDCPNTS